MLPDRPLLIALRWTGHAEAAPAAVAAKTDAGRTITLPVRRLAVRPREPRQGRSLRYSGWRWAAPPVEMFEVEESSGDAVAAHLLVVSDPNAWPGVGLNIGTNRVVLVPVEPDPREPSSAPLPESVGFDQPHSTSPLEAVRRGLWRRHVNRDAPIASHDDSSLVSLLGRQSAGRWHAALRDLALIDPALTLELERLLVSTAWDGSTRFSAWPAATSELIDLETILLSRLTDAPADEEWRLRVKAWMSRQRDAVAWVESDSGVHLSLACANLTTTAQRARISDARRPLIWGLDLPPSSVGRTLINRVAEALSDRVVVQAATTNRTLALLEPTTDVLPPGRSFENFWQSWTLDTWRAGEPAAPDPLASTSILARRSPTTQQWELIVTCALSQPLDEAWTNRSGPGRAVNALAGWSELVGYESITILYGFFGQPFEVLSVLPDGSSRAWRRPEVLSPERVQVEVKGDHWTATIRLPERFGDDDVGHFEFGVLRMHDRSEVVDCFPRPALPWRPDPGRMRLDLGRWDALPTPPMPVPVPEEAPEPVVEEGE